MDWKDYQTVDSTKIESQVGRGLFGVHLLILQFNTSYFSQFNLSFQKKISPSQNAQISPKNLQKTAKQRLMKSA